LAQDSKVVFLAAVASASPATINLRHPIMGGSSSAPEPDVESTAAILAAVEQSVPQLGQGGKGDDENAKRQKLERKPVDPKIVEQFNGSDADGDGKLSFDEMKGFLKQLNPKYSETDMQTIYCEADSNQDGAIRLTEFMDFILTGKPPEPTRDIVIEPPSGAAAASGVRPQWQQDVVDAHNNFRKEHGSDNLTWSDGCYANAKKQADACQAKGSMFHGTMEGPSGRHGQNIFWCSEPGSTAKYATTSWYSELNDPGYDFASPGFGSGTGHFTQVAWKSTKQVGMACSEDGKFIVANYFPAGNMMGDFEQNVLSRGTPYNPQDEPLQAAPGFEAAEGAVTAYSMTPELEKAFEGCPFPYKQKAEDAFSAGSASVSVERTCAGASHNIVVTINIAGKSASKMSGTWGGGCQ